jgi:hypothetical protein
LVYNILVNEVRWKEHMGNQARSDDAISGAITSPVISKA